MTRDIEGHFSHRGVSLMLLGGVWTVIGLGLLVNHDPSKFPVDLLPWPIPAFLWLLAGLGGIVAVLLGVSHQATDFVFGAFTVPAILRAGGFAFDWGLHLLHHGGEADAWIGTLAWLLIVAIIIHEATTPLIPRSLLRGPP